MSRGTTIRTIRINDLLWDAARSKAAAENRNLSVVVREFLNDYVSRPVKKYPHHGR